MAPSLARLSTPPLSVTRRWAGETQYFSTMVVKHCFVRRRVRGKLKSHTFPELSQQYSTVHKSKASENEHSASGRNMRNPEEKVTGTSWILLCILSTEILCQ